MGTMDNRVIERLAGPSWNDVRAGFLQACNTLLDVGEASAAELTTIYVKFSVTNAPDAAVYAVGWIKSARNVVIGLALQEAAPNELLIAAPKGMAYRGLTRYLPIRAGEKLPAEFRDWAIEAYRNVCDA